MRYLLNGVCLIARKGIVGQGYTKEAFGVYVKGLTFGLWRPSFLVLYKGSLGLDPTMLKLHAKIRSQHTSVLEAGYRKHHLLIGPQRS